MIRRILASLWLVGLGGMFGLVQAQTPPESPSAEPTVLMDTFLKRATVAAEAADLVRQAGELRRTAETALKAGNRDEAGSLLRRSEEILSGAATRESLTENDPLLREFLREVIAAREAVEVQTIPILESGRSLGRTGLAAGLARLQAYRPAMARIFREEGIPEWLLAVGLVESGYRTTALSPKQALGIWQFIPETGKRYGLRQTALVDERQDLEKSTRAAARYLRDLYAQFGDWPLVLAAYNAGEKRVANAIQQSGGRDFWTLAERRRLPAETINYVPAVLAAAKLIGSEERRLKP